MNDIDIDQAKEAVEKFLHILEGKFSSWAWGFTGDDGVRIMGLGQICLDAAESMYTTLLHDDGKFNNKITALKAVTCIVSNYSKDPDGLFIVDSQNKKTINATQIANFFNAVFQQRIEVETALQKRFAAVEQKQTPKRTFKP